MEKKSTREELDEVRLEKEKLRLALERKEFEQSGKILYKSEDKTELEFQRYKQDCRKRALDLASSQLHTPVLQKWLGENKYVNVDENTVTDKSPIMSDDLLMALADKYYNWLINIPNN